MIIGQTHTGKSVIIKTLKDALNQMKIEVESQTLNPKSVTMDELYGKFSFDTQEWKDGICSSIIREFVESESEAMKWVIFDGPVDAIWIENMNTVLDDNMTLCLSNGERIKLRPEMRMLFEIDDLSQASPATVSRCGMVFTSSDSINWRPIVQSWLAKYDQLTNKNKDYLWNLFEAHVDHTIDQMQLKAYHQPIPMTTNSLIMSLCSMI